MAVRIRQAMSALLPAGRWWPLIVWALYLALVVVVLSQSLGCG